MLVIPILWVNDNVFRHWICKITVMTFSFISAYM